MREGGLDFRFRRTRGNRGGRPEPQHLVSRERWWFDGLRVSRSTIRDPKSSRWIHGGFRVWTEGVIRYPLPSASSPGKISICLMPPTVRYSATALSAALNARRPPPIRSVNGALLLARTRFVTASFPDLESRQPDMHCGNDGTRLYFAPRFSIVSLFNTPPSPFRFSPSRVNRYRSSSTRVSRGNPGNFLNTPIGSLQSSSSRISREILYGGSRKGRVNFGHVRRIVRGESRKAIVLHEKHWAR